MRRVILVCCAVILAAFTAESATWQVTVQNFEFIPPTLTISQGDTVVWTNVLGTHDVHHACEPSLFGNQIASAPWVYQFVFDVSPGTYPYLCEVHPSLMLGSVTVLRVPQRWDVTVQNYSFTPANLTVQRGDTVVWTNILGLHSVHNTSSPSLFGTPIAAAPWTYSFVFDLPADTYPYICEVHPSLMQGTVTVAADPAAPASPEDLVVRVSGDVATLSWSPAVGAACYTVYRSQDVAPPDSGQLAGITGDTTFVESILSLPGTVYFFSVKSVAP